MANSGYASEFFEYLSATVGSADEVDRLPSLNVLSQELNVSVARLREQLEVAKAFGFVDVRPRTGIRRLPYNFLPAIWPSLAYAIAINPEQFGTFSDLRIHVEKAYWDQAVAVLTQEDQANLQSLIDQAWEKLHGNPVRIPHAEHRELHLSIFRKLDNPFVLGILEAYWEAYEAIGLSVYTGLNYLEKVWGYHQKMLDAIRDGDTQAGYEALSTHFELLYERPLGA